MLGSSFSSGSLPPPAAMLESGSRLRPERVETGMRSDVTRELCRYSSPKLREAQDVKAAAKKTRAMKLCERARTERDQQGHTTLPTWPLKRSPL